MLVVKKIKNRGKRVLSYVREKQVDYRTRPWKSLTNKGKKRSGRMKSGAISVRRRGGGRKRRYRILNLKALQGEFQVERLEKDPNRSAFIALIKSQDQQYSYILATNGLKPGQKIIFGDNAPIQEGNRTMLKRIPAGSIISTIQLNPDSPAQLARSAGSFAKLMGCEKGFAQVKLPSGEIRLIKQTCYASIGQVSNLEYNAQRIGKAGRRRNMGFRPQVRGKVMNPADHPHGGGEGNQPIGLPHPKTPWGKPALGVRTRRKKTKSNKYILKRRSK
ncbi:MAG: 50S ribosomal protein L2 [Candidatus Moranbacteria bacterium]|nr:50S ribosomal protein L2 [Candidatus Moranbacteria bacterium]